MELKDILLKKEELPILREISFFVPIHPTLLNPNIRLDPNIPRDTFRIATEEWYEDLKVYTESLEDKQKAEWIKQIFLSRKPKIKAKHSFQIIEHLSWEDQAILSDNGFARVFAINRNSGGSLYFNRDDSNCKWHIDLENGSELIKFSKEKLKEFGMPYSDGKLNGVDLYVYSQHNIDYFPGALLLRNWAILYMNGALKQTLS